MPQAGIPGAPGAAALLPALGAGPTFVVVRGPVAVVSVVLKTPTVYLDPRPAYRSLCRLELVYQAGSPPPPTLSHSLTYLSAASTHRLGMEVMA